jgi:bifunctional non-homologous end joining protein LigD
MTKGTLCRGGLVTRKTTINVDGQHVEVTNLDKVLYPSTGTTKADVIAYYQHVAPMLIEHAQWRPATLKRWVNGVGTANRPESGFFNKNSGSSAPTWVKTFPIEHSERINEYPLVNDAATLAWLAQLATLEIHTPQWRFGSRGGRRPPDRMVIDLDPGEGVGLARCGAVAILLRDRLHELGLDPMPVTSGSKGIHIYAPLEGSRSAETIAALAHELASEFEAEHPDLVVSNMARNLRAGKVLIDWSQNNGSKTTITPFSLRGRARPTVAAPRTWDEIADPDLRQLEYSEVLQRVVDETSE